MSTRIMIAVALVLGLVGTAQAATLATGPLRVDGSGGTENVIECSLVNIGKKDLEVTITVVLGTGSLDLDFVVPPGGTTANSVLNGGGWKSGYCRFDVKGGKKNVRASVCVRDEFDPCGSALPAS